MKMHAIIPIFIPHEDCPNNCVFCNQRRITTHSAAPDETEVRTTIEAWLSTLASVETVEIAFSGGSFTGPPPEMQAQYLAIARAYKTAGRIDRIRLSTRPDETLPAGTFRLSMTGEAHRNEHVKKKGAKAPLL